MSANLPVQKGQKPVRSVDPLSQLIQTIDRRIQRTAAYAAEPHAEMIVVSVNTGVGTMQLRRPTDQAANGYPWRWIQNGTTYSPGDHVLVSLDRAFPHVVGKLS